MLRTVPTVPKVILKLLCQMKHQNESVQFHNGSVQIENAQSPTKSLHLCRITLPVSESLCPNCQPMSTVAKHTQTLWCLQEKGLVSAFFLHQQKRVNQLFFTMLHLDSQCALFSPTTIIVIMVSANNKCIVVDSPATSQLHQICDETHCCTGSGSSPALASLQ